jgi:4-O-beta-D-mannosyl-D-glucose phosphorylase
VIHEAYQLHKQDQERLLAKKNQIDPSFYNGVMTRYLYPVLTKDHVPIEWRFTLDQATNPYFMERLGINSVFNAGSLYFHGEYYLMARVEGTDRKSFFALAKSPNGIDQFRFVGEPIMWNCPDPEETNVYDMRLTLHEDGYIYGLFCSEAKDPTSPPDDTVSAIARVGVLRTKDLVHFERLPNLVTPGVQERNVALHPEFVKGKYLLYTRPQDGFIETGSGGGIAIGFTDSMEKGVIKEEILIAKKRYHTIYELKNGIGPAPIKTRNGWIHFAHGVRNTAAGLRYVLYLFVTALSDPTQIIAQPSGYLLAPYQEERIGDVSNVLFTNGVIVNEKEEVFLYYAASDTRLHVATTTISKLLDYAFHSPKEAFNSFDCVQQRLTIIQENEHSLKQSKK